MFVKDIMSFPVITADEEETLRDVAIKMLENKIGALPVVDEEGKLVGFLSETDFTAKKHNIPFSRMTEPKLFGRWMRKDEIENMYKEARTIEVKEIMSKPVICVEEDDKIEELIKKIMKYNFHRVPVVKDGKPVGIVSRRDLLKLLI